MLRTLLLLKLKRDECLPRARIESREQRAEGQRGLQVLQEAHSSPLSYSGDALGAGLLEVQGKDSPRPLHPLGQNIPSEGPPGCVPPAWWALCPFLGSPGPREAVQW